MANIPFVSEPRPLPGSAVEVARGVIRITAPNSGPLTYHGTNSYIVATSAGNIVIDPGPDKADHIAALLELTRRRIAGIFITHGHGDHVDAVQALKSATAAPVYASSASVAQDLQVDVPLVDGGLFHSLRAIYTPGHSSDHFCFGNGDRVIFTGDHVMTWSTSAVSPPRGSMIDYRNSLLRLLDAEGWELLLPGHGAPSHEPSALISALLAHRLDRERQVLDCVKAGASTPSAIADLIYLDLPIERRGPAERTVWAYLLSLAQAGAVRQISEEWQVSI